MYWNVSEIKKMFTKLKNNDNLMKTHYCQFPQGEGTTIAFSTGI